MQKGMRIGVVGQGPRVAAVVQALGNLNGVLNVRQFSESGVAVNGMDMVVEMVGGVEPAFRTAMAALGGGMGCIVTSPMLAAVHGHVLRNAAYGQHAYLGLSAAGMGLGVEALCAPLGVTGMTAVWGEGANMLLARMAFRAEAFAQVEKDFIKHDMDLSDATGKVTQARAAAMLGAWRGVWPRVSGQVRIGVEAIEPGDFKRLREFGLGLVYGAEIGGGGFYTGPLAVSLGSVLLAGMGRDVLVMQSGGGESVLLREVDAEVRLVQGVVGDVIEGMRRKVASMRHQDAATLPQAGFSPVAEVTRCYVRVPFGRRDALLANVDEVMHERVEGDGSWQAVVSGLPMAQMRLLTSDGIAIPVVGQWSAPEQGLRLVG